MYKIILADDNPLILRALKKTIPWDRLRITVTAEAEDGASLKKKLKEYRPELLVTDIRMPGFSGLEVAKYLKEQGMEKLIVDLRGNPGGLLDSVCEIMDDLLPEGLIVYTEDKSGNRVEYNSEEGQLFDGELAVLVDQDTASAAEIFAGAVQDHEIGTIIGTQTYGKGLVQKTYTLSDGSGIKFTTENYFTPLGNNINGTGITPDIVLEEESEDETEEQTDPPQ